MASADKSGANRLRKSSSITYIAPKFGELAPEQNRLSRNAHRVLHARRFDHRFFDPLHHLLGPAHRCRVGQLQIDDQVTLVLRRNKTLRRLIESRICQIQQKSVAHEYQHRYPQQPADRPGVQPRRVIKPTIERPEDESKYFVKRPRRKSADHRPQHGGDPRRTAGRYLNRQMIARGGKPTR